MICLKSFDCYIIYDLDCPVGTGTHGGAVKCWTVPSSDGANVVR